MEKTIRIDVRIPAGWHELDQKRLLFVYSIIAADFSADELRTLCLMKWSGIKVMSRGEKGSFVVKHGDDVFEIKPMDIAEAMTALDWILDTPDMPVRLERIGKAKPLDALFRGVPLERFLAVEMLWESYLDSRQDSVLAQLAEILYGVKNPKLSPVHKVNVIYWISSLKKFMSKRFSYVYSSGKSDGTGSLGQQRNSAMDSANAMIRALTKGDITKERQIMLTDTWRALTEVNEQAREYRALNEQIKKK